MADEKPQDPNQPLPEGIREGAGLDESRLNTDFIDFLRTWGPWVLILVGAISLAFSGNKWLQDRQSAARSEAFIKLHNGGDDPATYIDVAQAESGSDVEALALIKAADLLYGSSMLGVKPGSTTNDQGVYSEEDIVDPETRDTQLTESKRLYEQAYGKLKSNGDRAIPRLRALFGIAATAESLGEFEVAREHLELAKSVAQSAGYERVAVQADSLLASANDATEAPNLYADNQLAMPPVNRIGPDPSTMRPPGIPQNATIRTLETGPDGKPVFPSGPATTDEDADNEPSDAGEEESSSQPNDEQ